MKKRIFIISTFIVILLFGIFYIYAKNDKHYKKVSYSDNIILSIDDGNQTLDSVPEKGPYEVRVYCSNADGVWDYNKWELVVKNVQGPVYCDLSFLAVSTSQNFASYIISLAGTSQAMVC